MCSMCVYNVYHISVCVLVKCVGPMCMCMCYVYECVCVLTVVCCWACINITKLTYPLTVSGDGVPHELPSVSVSV